MPTDDSGTRIAASASVEAPFDREGLLARLGGSVEILVEVAAMFCADAARMHAELRAHVELADAQAVDAAHQLKGALLNLSAGPASATARELEAAARAGDWSRARALIERLGGELEALVTAFQREQAA